MTCIERHIGGSLLLKGGVASWHKVRDAELLSHRSNITCATVECQWPRYFHRYICIANWLLEGERGGGEIKPLKVCHNTCISHTLFISIIITMHTLTQVMGMQYTYSPCNFKEVT